MRWKKEQSHSAHLGHRWSCMGLYLAMWAGVRYDLCKIYSCVSLSESFGKTNLQEARIFDHSLSSSSPTSAIHLVFSQKASFVAAGVRRLA